MPKKHPGTGSSPMGPSAYLQRAAESAKLTTTAARIEADALLYWVDEAIKELLENKGSLSIAIRSAHGGRHKTLTLSTKLEKLDAATQRDYADKLFEAVVFSLTERGDKSVGIVAREPGSGKRHTVLEIELEWKDV